MREVLMMRFSEIHLKGLNRPYFMRMLVERIKEAVKDCTRPRLAVGQPRLCVRRQPIWRKPCAACARCSACTACAVPMEMEKADFDAQSARRPSRLHGNQAGQSFKVEARRSDKRYPMDSMQIRTARSGTYILVKLPQLTVDVHNPQIKACPCRDPRSRLFVHRSRWMAAGGMPVGTSGRAMVLLSGGIDSPVAAWMIAKRGVADERGAFSSPRLIPASAPRTRCCKLGSKILSESLCGLERPSGALYGYSDAYPRALPPGLYHGHHAPLYDAHRQPKLPSRSAHRRWSPARASARLPARPCTRCNAPTACRICPCSAR